MMEDQADKLNLLVQPYSEEYFNSVHDNAKKLISKMEYGKALSMLEEVHDFIRKTDQTEQLSFNLILKAVVNLVSKQRGGEVSNILTHLFLCIMYIENQ